MENKTDNVVEMPGYEGRRYVDAKTVASTFGFTATLIRRMAKAGKIPALVMRNGSKDYYRFLIPEVEAALKGRYETTKGVIPEGHNSPGIAC